jgi:imidazolonepropionase-like amidohydrolase
MGTDSGVGPHGENAEELALMVEHGMSPMEALVSATSRAAQLLGLADRLGTIERGKLADLILVDGDPLARIDTLRDRSAILLVMKQGRVYKDLVRSQALQPAL